MADIDTVTNVLGIVTCSLSMIGSIVIIVAYYSLPELKTFGNKMIMYVGMSNLIYSIQTMVEFFCDEFSAYENGKLSTLCVIQAFISTYTSQCVLIWITILSITIHDTVKNRIANMAKRELIFIGIGFIVPLLLSAIPLISGSYGQEDNACWITSSGHINGQLQVWGLIYGPLWICIALNFILILKTLKILKDLEINKTETYFVIRRFLFYPTLWIICWLCGTINRSIMLAGGQSIHTLMSASTILISTQGFFTMIIFLSDKRISDSIKCRYNRSKQPMETTNGSNENNISEKLLKEQCQQECNMQISEEDEDDDYFGHISKEKDTPVTAVNAGNGSIFSNSDNSMGGEEQQHPIHNDNFHKEDHKQSSEVAVHCEDISPSNDQNARQPNQQASSSNQQQCKPENGNKGLPPRTKKRRPKRGASQKQQFVTSGQWNRMEKIEEDSDEDEFGKEIAQKCINNPEQLFLSKRDAKLLYKYHRQSEAANTKYESNQKRSPPPV